MDKHLPPLNAIRTFEVAAQHLSFVRAAGELGVTPSAISKQILILEDFIGVRLFERLPGKLELTLEGSALRKLISPVFDTLEKAFAKYSRRPPRSNVFRIATVASFASQFLVPRLNDFACQFPNLELEILTSDRIVDFAHEEIDLSIRFGSGDWSGLVSERLGNGQLIPVCAPGCLMEDENHDLEAFMASSKRIQVFSNDEWQAWEETTGIGIISQKPAFIMEHFVVALQAVLLGQAIALLPETIVRNHLVDGSLTQFAKLTIDWRDGFYLTHQSDLKKQSHLEAVHRWLMDEAQSGDGTSLSR